MSRVFNVKEDQTCAYCSYRDNCTIRSALEHYNEMIYTQRIFEAEVKLYSPVWFCSDWTPCKSQPSPFDGMTPDRVQDWRNEEERLSKELFNHGTTIELLKKENRELKRNIRKLIGPDEGPDELS